MNSHWLMTFSAFRKQPIPIEKAWNCFQLKQNQDDRLALVWNVFSQRLRNWETCWLLTRCRPFVVVGELCCNLSPGNFWPGIESNPSKSLRAECVKVLRCRLELSQRSASNWAWLCLEGYSSTRQLIDKNTALAHFAGSLAPRLGNCWDRSQCWPCLHCVRLSWVKLG